MLRIEFQMKFNLYKYYKNKLEVNHSDLPFQKEKKYNIKINYFKIHI
jgi:hypothetical protein